MKKITSTILLFLSTIHLLSAQDVKQSYKFRLYLKDKGNTEYSLSEPEKFLSKQSIERKNRQNVAIDEADIPISNDYFNLITLAGGEVISFSKWFQTIVVQLNDSSQINEFLNLSFVDSAKYVWRGSSKRLSKPVRPRLAFSDFTLNMGAQDFGRSDAQFALHNATNMYKSSFSGRGMNIAVIDAGFTNVDVIPYFSGSQIVEHKSFVPYGETMVDSDHGTRVLSTILSLVPGKIRGSANGANFYLLQSEEVSTEFPVEEDYWIRAVEYADSVGVDVINSSLGYSDFDDKELNYSHEQLDGRTAIMSLAADMAFDKGMIVVTSAGNEGNKPWQKISVPGDAAKALTVGAVDSEGNIASFSSKGYTADNRMKPDVVSVGRGTTTIGRTGEVGSANGTSFSSPFMAGMVATLWSINPQIDRGELLDIIKQSGDRYHNPDSVFGNGIPDMGVAMAKVLQSLPTHDNQYIDKYIKLIKNEDGSIDLTVGESKFDPKLYVVSVIDEDANMILQKQLDNSNIRLMVGEELNAQMESLFVVVTAPDIQKVIRLKL